MTRVSDRVIVLDGSSVPGRDVIGNKGASVARMRSLGLPVPPAFVLPIDECRRYHAEGERLDEASWDAVLEGVAGPRAGDRPAVRRLAGAAARSRSARVPR